MSRFAVFIDGGYLSQVLKEEFHETPIDFTLLLGRIAVGSKEMLRAYYYDCLPYQSPRPTRDESERFAKHQRFHKALTHIPRFQVQLGRLARRHYDDGRVYYEQKRVDILFGVDLVQLAAKAQIEDAVLIAGDSDLLPAIVAAKAAGVAVHLYHGATPHTDLVGCCDERTRIDAAFIAAVRRR